MGFRWASSRRGKGTNVQRMVDHAKLKDRTSRSAPAGSDSTFETAVAKLSAEKLGAA